MTDGQRFGISGRLAAAFQRNPLTPILAIMGLLPPNARVSGSIRLGGDELLGLDERELAKRRVVVYASGVLEGTLQTPNLLTEEGGVIEGQVIMKNPGKAPAKIIEARVGREAILEQVVNDALPAKYSEALAETFGSLFRRRPLYVVAMLLGMLAAAALVLLPFVLLRG